MNRALLFFLGASFAAAQPYTITTLAGGVPPITPAVAVSASIGDPPRVAVDASGNVYFASLYSVFKVDRAGTLTRIGGAGRRGISGDGGPALNAQLLFPVGLAVDAAGNVYFTERDSNIIRRIAANGTISTFAGTGARGIFGDGGPASAATFDGPTGLAVDGAGNLYVADTNNHSIRRIAPDGIITTVAGNGGVGYSGDGGPARDANLNGPEGVAVDAAGNLYIADTFNHRIRVVSANGIITTFAANGYPGYSGDNGPALSATLLLPTDLGVDRNGDVYIADLGNSRIRKVSNGSMATLAGANTGPQAVGVSPQPANAVRLSGPTGVAVDANGNVFFAEGSIGSGSGLTVGDYKIWKVAPDGALTAIAGNGYKSFSGDFGPASRAQMNVPAGVAIDPAGNLYFADSQNHRVRKISPGGNLTTVAGNGIPGFSGDGGPAVKAELNKPLGVAIDNAGNLFIVDSTNNRIRKVFPNGDIGTVAGNGNAAYFGDGGRAITAALHAPGGIAVDSGGNLYIADTLNHRVRKVDGGGIIDTVVGRGFGATGDGGPAILASLNLPDSVALDSAGNIYVADTGNGRIRKVSDTGTIETVFSSETPSSPRGVTLDFAGNLYFTDAAQHRIRRMAPDGAVTVIAGNGTCCYSGDGGPAASAQLNAPWGAASDPAGNLYFADAGNNAIRLIYAGSSTSFIRSVVNGASNLLGGLAPGEIVVVHGAGLGPAQIVQSRLTGAGLFPTQAAGTSVTFNGAAGPVLYTSAGQVSAIVPYGVTGGNVQIAVQYQGAATAPITLPLVPSSPAWFTADSTGSGQALALNRDGSSNGPAHPAAVGSFLTLYATGEGLTSPSGVDGKPANAPLPVPVLPVTVTIDGRLAFVQYAGGAPDAVAGVMQVNVQVPEGVGAGTAVPITLQIGAASSPSGVTIAVGGN